MFKEEITFTCTCIFYAQIVSLYWIGERNIKSDMSRDYRPSNTIPFTSVIRVQLYSHKEGNLAKFINLLLLMRRLTFVSETTPTCCTCLKQMDIRTCWSIQTHLDELNCNRRRTYHELNPLSLVCLMKSLTLVVKNQCLPTYANFFQA